MSYRVRIESFEGPFDLLLQLVSRQQVDIGAISITQIIDQYLVEVQNMRVVDLDVASDFLLVASTLLEIKASSLIPRDAEEVDESLAELDPDDLRQALVTQLLDYKKFKNAAAALEGRLEAQKRLHTRPFGPDRSLLTLMPDYLEGIELSKLGELCAACFARRDVFLLESEHIARHVLPVETQVKAIYARLKNRGRMTFSEFLAGEQSPHVVVATFLAMLELYKRSMVNLTQNELFDDIEIEYLEGSEEHLLEEAEFDSFVGD